MKMNRNIMKQIVFCVFAIFMAAGWVHADTLLTMGSDSASPGDIITLPFTLKTDADISALSTDLHYDASQLTFEYAKSSLAASGKQLVFNQISPKRVRLGLISLDNMAIENGDVLEVTFSVNAYAMPGKAIIRQAASGSTPDGDPLSVKGKAGRVGIRY